MANEQNYYQVLGLIPDAEPAVIRAAYRALVAIYHPDKMEVMIQENGSETSMQPMKSFQTQNKEDSTTLHAK